MFDIHDLRVNQNFFAINTICKREKIDFFLMANVIKLLQNTLDKGENFFDKRIELKRGEDKKILDGIIKNRGHLLLEFGEEAFSVMPRTYLLLEEIYNLQKEEDIKTDTFTKRYHIYFGINEKEFI